MCVSSNSKRTGPRTGPGSCRGPARRAIDAHSQAVNVAPMMTLESRKGTRRDSTSEPLTSIRWSIPQVSRLSHAVGLALAVTALGSAQVRVARSAPQEPPAEPAGSMKPYVEAIPGTDVKFEMIPIPGGTFLMGSPPGEAKRGEDEGPQHPVRIAALWMGKHEVTWEEDDQFAFALDLKKKQREHVDLSRQPESEKKSDAVTRPTPPYADETFTFGRNGQPVICITHHAAMEYCRWLSA